MFHIVINKLSNSLKHKQQQENGCELIKPANQRFGTSLALIIKYTSKPRKLGKLSINLCLPVSIGSRIRKNYINVNL